MKTKKLYILLAVFAAVCAVVGAMPGIAEAAFTSVLAFPFEQIALGLRALSLSSVGGNSVAIAIYAVVCLLPAGAMLLRMRKHGFRGEDALAFILSAAMFAAIYFMINPSLLYGGMGSAVAPMLNAVLGGVCWCVVVSWLVLKILRRSIGAEREGVQRLLMLCLVALAFVFVAVAFGGGVGAFLASGEKLREGNTGGVVSLVPTYIFLALQSAVVALPYVLDAILAVMGAETLAAMGTERYGEETAAKAEALSAFAALSLKITVVVSLVFNLLQFLFIRRLLVVDISISLPVVSLAFMLALALLSRLVRENKSLKDDNDLFI